MKSAEQDPIVALATPVGRGAIAVIRVSGSRPADFLSEAITADSASFPERRPILTAFLDSQGARLDRVVVTWFPAPESYTGEDVVEISCHGSPAVTTAIVDRILAGGARLAEPGEFTRRAFLNGKVDLVQAEAVRDLIDSHTTYQARVATQQLEGRLSRRLQPLKRSLIEVLSNMETALEFVEDQVQPETRKELIARLREVDTRLQELEESFRLGRLVRDGIEVAIVGSPNSGKSSLFNALVKYDRVLVTDTPGTTRDSVSETIELQGVPTRLLDTAGIRSAGDEVEELGIERSLEHLQRADLVLFVLDQHVHFGAGEGDVWTKVKARPHVIVLNKKDLSLEMKLPASIEQGGGPVVSLSALTGEGVDALRKVIWEQTYGGADGIERERVFLTNVRHRDLIRQARRFLGEGMDAYVKGMSEEYPIYDFRRVLESLGTITGEVTVEDILGKIFSTFCIGK